MFQDLKAKLERLGFNQEEIEILLSSWADGTDDFRTYLLESVDHVTVETARAALQAWE